MVVADGRRRGGAHLGVGRVTVSERRSIGGAGGDAAAGADLQVSGS
jgi:hypothetical protein